MNSRVILATDNRHRTDELTEQVTEYLSSFLQFQSLYKAISQRPSIDEENEENGEEERGEDGEEDEDDEEEEDDEPRGWWDDEDPDAPWMTQSTRLLPSTTLAMWQFTPCVFSQKPRTMTDVNDYKRYLALVVLLRTETWQARRGTIEYNLTFLRQGVREILSVV